MDRKFNGAQLKVLFRRRLRELSHAAGRDIYGIVWVRGSPTFVEHDPEASLGVSA